MPTRMLRIAVASLWCVLSGFAGEGDGVWRRNCEDRLPGEVPGGWHASWGRMNDDDMFTTSNMMAVEGNRSLLLDRTYGGLEGTHYGLLVDMPAVDAEWAALSFCFLAQGPRHQTSFSFEVRTNGGGGRVVVVGCEDGALKLRKGDFKKNASLAPVTFGDWHRITLWMPTAKADAGQVVARLERMAENGSWSQVGEVATIDAVLPFGKGNGLMLCSGSSRGYKIFIDDITLSRGNAPPAR